MDPGDEKVLTTLWLAEIPDNGDPLSEPEFAGLPAAEAARIARFRQPQDRWHRAVAVWLSHYGLEAVTGQPASRLTLVRDKKGRPGLGSTAFPGDFNISHHGRWVACATVPTGRVGVDIVAAEDFSPALIDGIASPEEKASLAKGRYDPVLSAKLWAAKESYVKMCGTGRSVDPRTLVFDISALRQDHVRLVHPSDTASFTLLPLSGGYWAAVCTTVPQARVAIRPVEWRTAARGFLCPKTVEEPSDREN